MKELDDFTIKSASNGDKIAFKKLYDHYSPFVWKVVFRTVNGDLDAAQSVMQDVFIKAHRSLKSFRYNAAFSTWLYRIAYNTAMTHLLQRKKAWQNRVEFNESLEGSNRQENYETHDFVEKILSVLKPDERFLLVAREIDNISFEELAGITEKSSGALRTQIHRIKETIRQGFTDGQSVQQIHGRALSGTSGA